MLLTLWSFHLTGPVFDGDPRAAEGRFSWIPVCSGLFLLCLLSFHLAICLGSLAFWRFFLFSDLVAQYPLSLTSTPPDMSCSIYFGIPSFRLPILL